MFIWIGVGVALLGFGLASYYDLKTTEVPDTLTNSLIFLGIILALLNFLIFKQFQYFLNSLLFGITFLSIGFLLYYLGIWGGADAKLLGILGFLVPQFPNTNIPFPLIFLPNFFLVGSIYLILYGLIYSLLNPKAFKYMKENFKNNFHVWLFSTLIIFFVSYFVFHLFSLIKLFSFVLASLPTLYIFSKSVEKSMIKRVKTKDLKVGDVLIDSRIWEGLKKNEIVKIRRKKKYVYIKEGVRFAPTFFISLLTSLFFQDITLNFILFLIS